MRFFGLLLFVSAIASGCGHSRNPRLTALVGESDVRGYRLINRLAEDDLTFQVPPQSLQRCVDMAQHYARPIDRSPRLSEPFSVRTLKAGCENELRMAARSMFVLTSVRMRLLIGADGLAREVEVIPTLTTAEQDLQTCLVASAKRNQFPRNFNNQPYEEQVDIVYYYSYIGETRWKMVDTMRRLDEPTRETCQCLLAHPTEGPVTFEAQFTLPEASAPEHAENLKVTGKGTSSPLAACYGAAIAQRLFYGRGASTDVSYQFKVLPTK